MTRNRRIPEWRPKPGQIEPIPRKPAAPNVPPGATARTSPVPPPPGVPPEASPNLRPPKPQIDYSAPTQPGRSPQAKRRSVPPRPNHSQATAHKATLPRPSTDREDPTSRPKRRSLRFPSFSFVKSIQFWAFVAGLLILGTGGLAAALLFKLPALPNCPSIFWPTASASLRLYCAQLASNKQTVDDLLEAITLVNQLPVDHPMRPEVDRYIERWSQNILELAEKTFNKGDLQGAIAIANRIPNNTSAHALVADRIKQWQEIWTKAEKIFDEAEEALLNQDPRQAFQIAVRLLEVGNDYWETTKYQELNDLITVSREDGNKLARIRRLARRGGLSNLLKALEMAKQIQKKSPAFPAAQRLIASIGKDMLELADEFMGRRDMEEAMSIVRKIPPEANLQNEIRDFTSLAEARSQAWSGSVADLEAAIIQAQRIRRERPLYGTAQQLITRWQLEIQDVNTLNNAQQMADLGTVDDLRAAIAEASRIPRQNPRGPESRELISEWSRKIQLIEDQPLLDQAEQYASIGDLDSLQTAVNIASRIGSGRALSREARDRIREWTRTIQEAQDQPILTRAQQLADAGNLPAAISTAEQIQSGRALSDTAEDNIRTWRAQVEGQARLQEAYQAASPGTATALVSGIRIANQVPENSPARSEADSLINQWSQQVLSAAQEISQYNLPEAIALAEGIPARSEAYSKAQQQLQTWRQMQAGSELNGEVVLP